MLVKKTFTATCKGCKATFNLYEYVGLEGGLYGSHHCAQVSELLLTKSARWKSFKNLKEVKVDIKERHAHLYKPKDTPP